MSTKIDKSFQGYVPMYIPHPTKLCAVYHCQEARVIMWGRWRRYCKKHVKEYDADARLTPTKVLKLA